jgi:hypothetical protein
MGQSMPYFSFSSWRFRRAQRPYFRPQQLSTVIRPISHKNHRTSPSPSIGQTKAREESINTAMDPQQWIHSK